MNSFLQKVSRHCLEYYGDSLEKICIVLPNRRAGLFLRKNIASLVTKPVWSPQVFSIEDFIAELHTHQPADHAEQLFMLYAVYKESEKEKAETFEAFCKWAPVLLNDFSEAERYLADTKKLFGNLSEIKTIENWSLGQKELTDFQKQYIHFWKKIGDWHKAFNTQLLAEKKYYPGLAYRVVAENIAEWVDAKKWKKIIFAGFNALSKSEEKIMATLRANGKADVLWDADHYYLDNEENEAGMFLRQYREKYFRALPGSGFHFDHTENNFSATAKNITVAGVARIVSQAKAAAHFLSTLPVEEMNAPQTAVVLCDDQLLLPLLNALPGQARDLNVTMGFPLRGTAVTALCDALFLLHENALRFNIKTREGELKFYHADIIRLIRHPWLRMILSPAFTTAVENYFVRNNIVFCAVSRLQKVAGTEEKDHERLENFFREWKNAGEALENLVEITGILRASFAGEQEDVRMETEFLYQLSFAVNRARTLTQRWDFAQDISALKTLIRQQLAAATLPFYGEPLSGLQIMGMLETRTLDFKNIILLAANENILPPSRQQHTFIMHDLRREFGLPAWNEKDALYAYHFYRLLQRAENIFITFNTEQDVLGTREKSRFVTQLLHELPRRNKNAKTREVVFDAGLPAAGNAPLPVVVQKNGDVIAKLEELAANGFSPTALNRYRACSLQFYFHHVAEVREKDEVEETIEANTLGTIIHGALEKLFTPYTGKQLTGDAFALMKKNARSACEEMFRKFFPGDESAYGKNLLAKKSAVRYVEKYLETERGKINGKGPAELPTVVALEKEMKAEFRVGSKQIFLKGKTDRVDLDNRGIVLLDFKTGKAENKELKVDSWDDLLHDVTLDKSFQLLLYAWLWAKTSGENSAIRSGIIALRKMKEGLMPVTTPSGEILGQNVFDEFEKILRQLLEEIFDNTLPFSQTEDISICRKCAFNVVCRKV